MSDSVKPAASGSKFERLQSALEDAVQRAASKDDDLKALAAQLARELRKDWQVPSERFNFDVVESATASLPDPLKFGVDVDLLGHGRAPIRFEWSMKRVSPEELLIETEDRAFTVKQKDPTSWKPVFDHWFEQTERTFENL